jgi:hypothetical protein
MLHFREILIHFLKSRQPLIRLLVLNIFKFLFCLARFGLLFIIGLSRCASCRMSDWVIGLSFKYFSVVIDTVDVSMTQEWSLSHIIYKGFRSQSTPLSSWIFRSWWKGCCMKALLLSFCGIFGLSTAMGACWTTCRLWETSLICRSRSFMEGTLQPELQPNF